MPAIEASELTKIYRTYRKERGLWGAVKGLGWRRYDETRAADQVSFQIEEGEFVGFLGPNGAGKTTVLKMLSGLLNPTSGEARVLGFVPWERRNEMKRQFSLLMGQKNALWWDLPAQESLELNRAIYGIDRERFKKVVDGLSDLLEVRDKMNVMVRELSLGERMKMELIAALIHEPRVLFLDEPTIGLDVVSQKRVREFLRIYNEEHRIVTLLTSHYMQDIEELCHRVLVIDHGKIFFDGPLAAIVDRFSGYKILSLTFETEGTRDLSAFGEIIEQTPVSVQLKVPRAKVTETCRQVLEACDVSDINVQEVPVEDVIRQLFGETHEDRAAIRVRYRGSCTLSVSDAASLVTVLSPVMRRIHRAVSTAYCLWKPLKRSAQYPEMFRSGSSPVLHESRWKQPQRSSAGCSFPLRRRMSDKPESSLTDVIWRCLHVCWCRRVCGVARIF